MRKPYAPPNAWRRRLLLGGTALVAGTALARRAAGADSAAAGPATPRPLEIGLVPYAPVRALVAGHQPLRQYFEDTFKRPVTLSTAPDFRSFQRRVLDGAFDFAIIGPGPGWQVHVDRKHPIVAVSRRGVRILFVAAANSAINGFADLRGKTLATIDPLTISSQTAMVRLEDHKLRPGVDVRLRHEKTPFNCVQGVILGEVAAASITNAAFANLPAEMRAQLRIFHESEEFPGVFFMVRPAPDMPDPGAFQATLFRFANDTEAGRAFVKAFHPEGLARPDLKALAMLDRFVAETRREMERP